MSKLNIAAEALDHAAQTATDIPQWSGADAFSVDEAYAVQALSIERRLARGERLAGYKMGLTSRAKMAQVGVDTVIWGRLTDAMRVAEGGEIARDRYIHPRAEPEIAFVMGRRLEGRVSPAEAMAAVDSVCVAIEIIDSRYKNFQFALGDVIADNTSAAGFVLGDRHSPTLDIGNRGMLLEVDGTVREIGSSAAILGHPARALVEASALLATSGLALQPGDIVLAGAATAAVPLSPGMSVRTVVEGLGAVHFRTV
ncbi:2-keto-4-pentenoate hydratase [Mesorhizobium sp. ANAO-SY3R2]|uniref:2-keto-4-pentenoate hydratase n=1 Tax=Mesorhizobium sp. ANAO-SY3R2 TaxID=3166644 RepID=UPI0036731546